MNKKPETPEQDVQIIAGEYVLGTLSDSQRAEVQQRLAHDPALRKAVDGWQSRLLALTDMAEPAPSSAGLWRRIERSLGDLSQGAKSSTRSRRPSSRKWNGLVFWRRLAVVSVIAALLLGTQLATQVTPTAAPAWMAVLSTPQDKTPGWVIQAIGANEIQLIPLGSTSIPEDSTLQFWTESSNGQGLVSLGRVKSGAVLKVPLRTLPPLQPNQLFELTLEKAAGIPASKPSGPIQFIGRAVKVI
ncbi:anti-sigma factor domain-containing protein [Pseudomonas sp. NPDC090202]|uniref:anti-sigma factor n=1 Tax=unclassified Pseudomonas TaxID=196821 RepID=UPI0038070AA4